MKQFFLLLTMLFINKSIISCNKVEPKKTNKATNIKEKPNKTNKATHIDEDKELQIIFGSFANMVGNVINIAKDPENTNNVSNNIAGILNCIANVVTCIKSKKIIINEDFIIDEDFQKIITKTITKQLKTKKNFIDVKHKKDSLALKPAQ